MLSFRYFKCVKFSKDIQPCLVSPSPSSSPGMSNVCSSISASSPMDAPPVTLVSARHDARSPATSLPPEQQFVRAAAAAASSAASLAATCRSNIHAAALSLL